MTRNMKPEEIAACIPIIIESEKEFPQLRVLGLQVDGLARGGDEGGDG